MTTFKTRLLGVCMAASIATFAWGAAATPATATTASIPGTYLVHVAWLGAGNDTFRIVLNADGTGTLKHFGNAIDWTANGTDIQFVIEGGDPATFLGTVRANGFSSVKHPGTMTNVAGDSGTWRAARRSSGG